MKITNLSKVVGTLMVAALSTLSAHAAVLAYEGFYTTTDNAAVNGFSNANSIGLSGTWSRTKGTGEGIKSRTSSTGWDGAYANVNNTFPVKPNGLFNFVEFNGTSLFQAQCSLASPVSLGAGATYISFVSSASSSYDWVSQAGLFSSTTGNELMVGNGWSTGTAVHYNNAAGAGTETCRGNRAKPTMTSGWDVMLWIAKLTQSGTTVTVSLYGYDLNSVTSLPASEGVATALWTTTVTGVTETSWDKLAIELSSWNNAYPSIGQIRVATTWQGAIGGTEPVNPPSVVGAASPNPANVGDNVLLTATVTPGGSPTISSVVVDASAVGGSSSLNLVSAGSYVYTNSVMVTSATSYGSPLSFPVVATDGNASSGATNISLTVNARTVVSTNTWVGNTDANWSTTANWIFSTGSGPVLLGDSLVFGAAGSAGSSLNNDIAGLTISKLIFNSGASDFTIDGNDLAIGTGGIDASALSGGTQTISVGITPTAGLQRWNVGSGATLVLGGLPTQFGPNGGMVIISQVGATITTTAANGWDWRGGGPGLLGPGFVIDNGNRTYDWAASTGASPYTIAAVSYMAAGNTDKNNVMVNSDTTVSPNASWASLLVQGATLTHNGANLYLDTGIILENGGAIAGSGPIKANNDGLYIYVPDSGTISSSIQNNGANAKLLYKAGPGTLTLLGANTYTGNTVIYEGSLVQSTAATGAGGYVVKDGATLGVSVVSGGALKMSSLSFGNSTNLFTGIVTNSAAITNTGVLTLAGTVRVNVSGLLPVGQYPLINSASISGSGGFVLGELPSGVVANIVTNGNTIALNVTVSTPPTLLWTGLTDNLWDFSTGNNWLSNAVSSIYSDGQIVKFDDSSTQTNVTIAAPVSPLLLTVSNSASAYTFSGAAITGPGSLTKSGNGTLVLATANTYSGGTTISNGVLQLGDALSANGSVAGNITDHGTLIFANPSDQTYSGVISGTGSMIKTASGNLTLGVNNTYAGGTLLDNGPVTLPNGAVQAFGTGTLTLSNATLYVKPGGGSSYNSANSIYLGNNVVVPAGTTSTIDNSQNNFGNLWVGGDGVQWTGSGTVTIQNSSSVMSAAVLWNGNPLATFSGTLNIGATGSGTMYVGIGYNSGNGGTGSSVATFDASSVALTLDSSGSTLCQVVDQNCTTVKFGSLVANNANTMVRGNSSSNPANQVTYEIGALNTSTYFAGKIADWGSSGTALKKVGSGTLTLAGANTYTGNTIINGGTLEIVQPVIATNSTVSITNGAKLQLGFTETNQVAALVLNGVSQPAGVYNVVNQPAYFLGTGSLVVAPPGPSGPEPIVSSYNPGTGQLSLAWTAGVNWRLESQTNSLSTGLSQTGWSTVTGASDGSYSVTVDRTQPTVFYRLVYP